MRQDNAKINSNPELWDFFFRHPQLKDVFSLLLMVYTHNFASSCNQKNNIYHKTIILQKK